MDKTKYHNKRRVPTTTTDTTTINYNYTNVLMMMMVDGGALKVKRPIYGFTFCENINITLASHRQAGRHS